MTGFAAVTARAALRRPARDTSGRAVKRQRGAGCNLLRRIKDFSQCFSARPRNSRRSHCAKGAMAAEQHRGSEENEQQRGSNHQSERSCTVVVLPCRRRARARARVAAGGFRLVPVNRLAARVFAAQAFTLLFVSGHSPSKQHKCCALYKKSSQIDSNLRPRSVRGRKSSWNRSTFPLPAAGRRWNNRSQRRDPTSVRRESAHRRSQ